MTVSRKALLILATLVLAACHKAEKSDTVRLRYEDYAGPPVDSFHIVSLGGWEPAGRNKVLIWNGPSEAYLITVWKNCNNPYFANLVTVSSTAREVSLVERVRIDDMECPILSIRPVDVKAMREDLEAQRKAKKARAQPEDEAASGK